MCKWIMHELKYGDDGMRACECVCSGESLEIYRRSVAAEFYSLGHWLGECFIKVNEWRPRPFHCPCLSLSACYTVTLQMYKSLSLSFTLSASLLLALTHTRRESANMSDDCPIKLVLSGVFWDAQGICVFCYVYESSMSNFKQLRSYIHIHVCTHAKLLCLTSVTSFYQTWRVKVAIQFVSV